GESPEFGFLQGLNDFNANPAITDSSSGSPYATITGVAIVANAYTLTSANAASGTTTVYNGTGFGAVNSQVGFYFTVAGFANVGSVLGTANNGTYICTANTAIALTLSHANGVAQTIAATATDYVLTVTSVNTFTVGQEVVLSGTAESFLNGTTVTVVSASGTAFAANYPTWSENYTNAADTGVATAAGGNTWTLVGNINLVDSDYTVSSVPPVANSTPYPDY